MPKCQVGVVGTGVMATGTATLLICNRYPAVLYGRTQESCERGLRSVRAALDDLIAAGVLQEAQRDKALTYLSASTAYEDLAGCQFVIESAAETIDTKREVGPSGGGSRPGGDPQLHYFRHLRQLRSQRR